jgi:2',3'-cyclic-nucleotide 2'-phosphodiesterase (5'-nucleotidase family)
MKHTYTVILFAVTLLFSACFLDDLPEPDEVDPDFGTNRFDSREHETALGDMICDGLVWYVNHGAIAGAVHPVDFAVLNGGIFEYGLEKGNITAGMTTGMIKGDYVTTVQIRAAQVKELFTWLAALRLGDNAWAQVSEEVKLTIDWTNGMGQLRELEIKGIPIDTAIAADVVYYAATGDVLVHGKRNTHIDRFFPAFKAIYDAHRTGDNVTDTDRAYVDQRPQLVSDAVYAYVASRPRPYRPEIDGRITIEK